MHEDQDDEKSALTFHDMCAVFYGKGSNALQFSINNGLLPSDLGLKCLQCHADGSVKWLGKEVPTDFKLVCGKCLATYSTLKNTIFCGAKLSIKQCSLCLYCWLLSLKPEEAAVEAKVSVQIARRFYQLLQEVCYIALSRRSVKQQIGGRRKKVHVSYLTLSRLLAPDTHWVDAVPYEKYAIVGYEAITEHSFAIQTEEVDADTVIAAIRRLVAQGSEVIIHSNRKLSVRFINYSVSFSQEPFWTVFQKCPPLSSLDTVQTLYFAESGLMNRPVALRVRPFLRDLAAVFPGYGQKPATPESL